MPALYKLQQSLTYPDKATYTTNGIFPLNVNGVILPSEPQELLTVQSQNENEKFMIAYYNLASTRVAYSGLDVNLMKETVNKLRLPKGFTSNIGELIFQLYGKQLENERSGPIMMEQEVVQGNEKEFRLILNKLNHVYSGLEIDQNFYSPERKTA